jgi:hypothetical protein
MWGVRPRNANLNNTRKGDFRSGRCRLSNTCARFSGHANPLGGLGVPKQPGPLLCEERSPGPGKCDNAMQRVALHSHQPGVLISPIGIVDEAPF